MRSWVKSYWSNCLSIAAIICSIVTIVIVHPSNGELGMDYIGIIVGILSLLVTTLMGWQIWNTITIESKIKSEVKETREDIEKIIDKTTEDLSIAGARGMTATLYKTENVYLNVCILTGDYNKAINTLSTMLEYAIALNESDRLREMVKIIINSKHQLCNRVLTEKDYEIIYKSFLKLSQNGLTRLSASDELAHQLYAMMNEMQSFLNNLRLTDKKTSPKEEQ